MDRNVPCHIPLMVGKILINPDVSPATNCRELLPVPGPVLKELELPLSPNTLPLTVYVSVNTSPKLIAEAPGTNDVVKAICVYYLLNGFINANHLNQRYYNVR